MAEKHVLFQQKLGYIEMIIRAHELSDRQGNGEWQSQFFLGVRSKTSLPAISPIGIQNNDKAALL